MANLSGVAFFIPAGVSITPGWGIYRVADRTYFDFTPSGGTAQTFTASPALIASPLTMLAAGAGGGVSKWVPTTPLDVTGGLLAQFGGSTGAAFVYELFDLAQDPPALSLYSDPIGVWIAGGTDQIPPGSGGSGGLDQYGLAIQNGDAVVASNGDITFMDEGTSTPRITYHAVALPGGRTVTKH